MRVIRSVDNVVLTAESSEDDQALRMIFGDHMKPSPRVALEASEENRERLVIGLNYAEHTGRTVDTVCYDHLVVDERNEDPFHCLLGLCRVLGMKVDIERVLGKYHVCVSVYGLPSNFFHPRETGMHEFVVAGAISPISGLIHAMAMCWGKICTTAFHFQRGFMERWEYTTGTNWDRDWSEIHRDSICVGEMK
ncbi:MAG: hypothetical protein KGL39_50065, partial [Patescibacteria group bacterium]|nr:hypothetical protein [Patescibacteria group bacterium]